MTVIGRIMDRRAERRSLENPLVPISSPSLLDWLGGPKSHAGVSVTQLSAYQMTAVLRAVAILSGMVGALPWRAYDAAGPDRQLLSAPIIDEPMEDTPFEQREWLGQSVISWGNGYGVKHRDRMDVPRELELIHPGDVRTFTDRKFAGVGNRKGKAHEVNWSAETTRTLTSFDVLHIRGLSYDGVVGMSPIAVAREAIGLGMAAEKYGARMFGEGALNDTVVEVPEMLGDKEYARLRADLDHNWSGPEGHWKVQILEGGGKMTRVGLPPEDAQWIVSRRFQISEVARLFGLPPHLLADVERSTSWGSGIEQQMMQTLIVTLDPLLVRIEHRVGRELVVDPGSIVRFSRQALLRPDAQARSLFYQRMLQTGAMNADQIAAFEDLPPLPDGQGKVRYRPTATVPVAADLAALDDDGDDDGGDGGGGQRSYFDLMAEETAA